MPTSEYDSEVGTILAESNPEIWETHRNEKDAEVKRIDQAGRAFDKAREVGVAPMEGAEYMKAYTAPQHPYGRILVRAGEMVSFRDPTSPLGQRDVRRDGDIWAVFRSGVCVADLRTEEGRQVSAWCEAHADDKDLHYEYHTSKGENPSSCSVRTDFCRDVEDPLVEAWSEMKLLQATTAGRNPQISPSRDIGDFLKGRSSSHGKKGQASEMIEAGRRQIGR